MECVILGMMTPGHPCCIGHSNCSQWRSQGGAKRAIAPPFFLGERVGGRAICHVVTLGNKETWQGTGHGD